jgi:uncharacterized protein (DUF697 family)/GTPase Era involved in 16S rRNA processing
MANVQKAVVIVAGQTGVGKSTLVNAVLGIDDAKTGFGQPVTKECREFSVPEKPITLVDTRGLELSDFQATIDALEREILRRKRLPPAQWVHLAWVCVSERSARVQSGDTKLVKMLNQHGVPTIVVVTKALNDPGFTRIVANETGCRDVVRVRAIKERVDEGSRTLSTIGLEALVERSCQIMPESVAKAFEDAQVVNLSRKLRVAEQVVRGAAAAAAAAAAAPLPAPAAVVLVPIQLAMFGGITAAFGLNVSKATLSSTLGSVIGSTIATVAGRMIVGQISKFVPIVGTIAGGLVNAAVASTLTYSIGRAFIEVLRAAKWTGDTEGDWNAIRDALLRQLKKDP